MFVVARVGGRMRSLGHCYGEDTDMMMKGPRRIKVSVQIEQEQRDVKLKDRLELSLSLKTWYQAVVLQYTLTRC